MTGKGALGGGPTPRGRPGARQSIALEELGVTPRTTSHARTETVKDEKSFRVRFQEISTLFDQLEAELGQISAGSGSSTEWDSHQVMVVELIRLRMKRVVDRLLGFGVDLPFARESGLESKQIGPESSKTEQNKVSEGTDARDQAIAELRETVSDLMMKSTKMKVELEQSSEIKIKLEKLQKDYAMMERDKEKVMEDLRVQVKETQRVKRIMSERDENAKHTARSTMNRGSISSQGADAPFSQLSPRTVASKDYAITKDSVDSEELNALLALATETQVGACVDFAESEIRTRCTKLLRELSPEMHLDRKVSLHVRIQVIDERLGTLWYVASDGERVTCNLADTPASECALQGRVLLQEQPKHAPEAIGSPAKKAGRGEREGPRGHSKDEARPLALFLPLGDPFRVAAVAEVWGEHGEDLRPLLKMDPGLALLLTQAGYAISRAVEFQQLNEGASMFRSLYNSITPLFLAVDDISKLTSRLESTCASLLSAEFVKIFILDHNRDALITKMHGQEISYALRDSENVNCHVAVTGACINLSNAQSDRRFRVDFSEFTETPMAVKSSLALPIPDTSGKVYGVISAANKISPGAGGGFNSTDEKLAEDFAMIAYVALSISVDTAGTKKAIESVVDQRNNLLKSAGHSEVGKSAAAKCAQVMADVAAASDPITVIHRLTRATEELSLLDIRYVPLSKDNFLMAEVATSVQNAGSGPLARCCRQRATVKIEDYEIETGPVQVGADIPRDIPREEISAILYIPFFLITGEQRHDDTAGPPYLSGVFRFSAAARGRFDEPTTAMLEQMVVMTQNLCDRANIQARASADAASTGGGGLKSLYGAVGVRGLLKAAGLVVPKKLLCARTDIYIAQVDNSGAATSLWTLTGPDLETRVEFPISQLNIEGSVMLQGIVVSSSTLTKPSLCQALGAKPTSILALPLRHHDEILGVIVAVDKRGRVPFDQVDEITMQNFASIAGIALRHHRDKLTWSEDQRRQSLLLSSIQNIMTCSSFKSLLTAASTSVVALAECTTAQFFVLNSTADYFVSLALEKPDNIEDKPDNPEDAAGSIEQLEVGRSAYVDVLRGKVLWPNERLPGGLIVTCVYPCAMVRGRVTGFFRLIEKEVPTSEQPYRLDLLSQVSTTCAEMYIRLQRAHGDLAKPEKASARLVLVCRNDGKLLRFNGSTKAVLGASDSILRSQSCLDWMPHNDIFTLVVNEVLNGRRTGVTQVQNFHWILKGRVLTAELTVVPFFVRTDDPSGDSKAQPELSHVYIAFANVTSLDSPLVRELCLDVSAGGNDEDDSERSSEGFVLAAHLQLLRKNATDQEFALVSVLMKMLEAVTRYHGRLYMYEGNTVAAIFEDAENFLTCGVNLDRDLGPLVDDFGYDLTVVGAHARLPKACTSTTGHALRQPFLVTKLVECFEENEKALASKGKKNYIPKATSLEQAAETLEANVPREVHRAVMGLLQRALLWPFRGFVTYALPAEVQTDFIDTPIELAIIPEHVPVKTRHITNLRGKDSKWMTDKRATCLHCVHGSVKGLSPAAIDQAHRMHSAFRAHLRPLDQVVAVREFVSILTTLDGEKAARGALLDGGELSQIVPQVILLLRRSLKILMDTKTRSRWKGVWSDPEPTLAELGRLVEPFAQTLRETEPWQREFFENTIALLEKVDSNVEQHADPAADQVARMLDP